jgi:predicted class III extradiol MEMO1 family dioxygenase
LKIVENSSIKAQLKTKFVKYAQSEQVKDPAKSSVSYASSITYIE